MTRGKLFAGWLYARRAVLLFVAAMFGFFFLVYGLYGHAWSVAGYAALLSTASGLALAGWDFARFATRQRALARLEGHFPTGPLPELENIVDEAYTAIIGALEDERRRLTQQSDKSSRDAQEYYTLWAHQIKTPIAAMRLLLQSGAAGVGRQGVAKLEQELFRIEQYVDMVLQYQRLSTLQNDLALAPFDVQVLVKKAAKNCAPLFIHKRLALDVEGAAGSVITDEKWFCFVLEQLFTNAVKYTPAGGVKVYSPDAHTLVVEDTGVGIAPEDVPRVFERGFTGAVGRSERSSTGIGLYLCRRILTRLGFGISIESVPGQGTRVLLHLRQQQLDVE